MQIQQANIQPGAVFSNGSVSVRVAANHGVQTGLRLDQVPSNGIAYAPWFRAEQDVAEFLSRGGHVAGAPFQPVAK